LLTNLVTVFIKRNELDLKSKIVKIDNKGQKALVRKNIKKKPNQIHRRFLRKYRK